jgi:hypothetical protein
VRGKVQGDRFGDQSLHHAMNVRVPRPSGDDLGSDDRRQDDSLPVVPRRRQPLTDIAVVATGSSQAVRVEDDDSEGPIAHRISSA